MADLNVVIGAGSIGQAVARRASAGTRLHRAYRGGG